MSHILSLKQPKYKGFFPESGDVVANDVEWKGVIIWGNSYWSMMGQRNNIDGDQVFSPTSLLDRFLCSTRCYFVCVLLERNHCDARGVDMEKLCGRLLPGLIYRRIWVIVFDDDGTFDRTYLDFSTDVTHTFTSIVVRIPVCHSTCPLIAKLTSS